MHKIYRESERKREILGKRKRDGMTKKEAEREREPAEESESLNLFACVLALVENERFPFLTSNSSNLWLLI